MSSIDAIADGPTPTNEAPRRPRLESDRVGCAEGE